MRKYLLATCVLAVLATPAFADVSGPYVGIEGGFTVPPQETTFPVHNQQTG